jgi:hypothetical protein
MRTKGAAATMKPLHDLIGKERHLDEVNATLRHVVHGTAAAVVGALEVNCSDESQLECTASFQMQFVEHLLPYLKIAARAPMRTCNLGARYEWGSVRVAEHHYATPAAHEAFKLLVVKVNGHVSASEGPDGPLYGPMQRYQADSTACGALHSLLAGGEWPALVELRETFQSDGRDRITALLDPRQVAPEYRYLFAAIVGARLQARRALEDIQQHRPHSPTLYLIVPCVTFNRPGPDTEFVVGFYWADCRTRSCEARYDGLGDDPERYRVISEGQWLQVVEE